MSDAERDGSEFSPRYPENTVIGVLDEPREIQAVVTALGEMSIAEESIDVVSDKAVEEQIEAYRAQHPWKARIVHFLIVASNESEILEKYDRWLNDGRFVIRVPIQDGEQAEAVAKVMQQHGGHFVNHFGPRTITTLVP